MNLIYLFLADRSRTAQPVNLNLMFGGHYQYIIIINSSPQVHSQSASVYDLDTVIQ